MHSLHEPKARVLIIACGALAKEIVALKNLNEWHHLDIQCIDAKLHHRPALIPARLKEQIERYRDQYEKIFVGYADCGTAGGIDRLIEEYGIERLPGADCFACFAGLDNFKALNDEELGTFYLTDFLVRQFDFMVIQMLGIDKHPELRDDYFGNYKRVVYLSQIEDEKLLNAAKVAAERLSLPFVHLHCGYGEVERALSAQLVRRISVYPNHGKKSSHILA